MSMRPPGASDDIGNRVCSFDANYDTAIVRTSMNDLPNTEVSV